jgi:hypothetical protein
VANCTGRFTSAGRAKVASYLKDTDQLPEIYVAWGSGTDTIANTDTALGFEIARKKGTVTRTDADTYTVTASFEVETAGTFSEMGLFDALSGGAMLYRGGYSADSPVGVYDIESLTVAVGDTLNLTIDVDLKSTNVSVSTAGKTKVLDILSAKTS